MPNKTTAPQDAQTYTGINRLLRSQSLQKLLDSRADGTFRTFRQDWRWIFSYSRKYRMAVLFYIVMGLVSATLSLAASVAGKYLIDIVLSRRTDQLPLLALAAVGGTVVSVGFSSLVNRLSARISIDVNNDIQADIFSCILDADWAALNRYASGDLLHRFTSDVNAVASNAVNWLPSLLIGVYTFLTTLFVILYYDAAMALIALLSAPFLLLSGRTLMRRMQEHRREVLELNSRMMSFENETFGGMDTIKSFGLAGRFGQELGRRHAQYRDCNLRYNLFSIQANAWIQLLGAAVSYAAFGYCLLRLWSGAITFGTMTLFLQQSNRLASNFSSLIKIVPGMLNGALSAHRVRELTELPRERHDPLAAARLQQQAAAGLTVTLDGVSFGYDADHPVLHDCSISARPGEIVALVGPSGEGKTTLLRLLLGLVAPQQGSVTLRGADGQAFALNADTRSLFGYVPQGNTVFSGTIARNLRLVRPDADDGELIQALQDACAWDFVRDMPQGIDSPVGERGRGLSEGQAQRLALARALLCRDAPVLLLDEATSALDSATEQKILYNLMHACEGRTCIITTHRPSVLGMCDRVYRVSDGTVQLLDQAQIDQIRFRGGVGRETAAPAT